MKSRLPKRVLGITAALACVAGAWNPCAAQFPTRPAAASNLATQGSWVTLYVSNGQIRVYSRNFSGGASSSTNSGDRKETFNVNSNNGICQLQYDQSNSVETIHIDLQDNGERATVTVHPKTDGPQLKFVQGSGTCSLTATIGKQTWDLRGETIWHLFLAEPELCQKQLGPLFAILRPNWKLADTASGLEEALFKAAADCNLGDTKRWDAWIEELAAPSYAQRHAADRQLREVGRAIVPYLQNLDRSRLEAEQRARIQAILSQYLGGGSEDSEERLANQFLGDRRIWFSLLQRDDAARRKRAAEQLSRLLNEKLDFDPAADAETRKVQIEKLRPRFELPGKKDQ